MIAARAIAILICCVFVHAVARAEERSAGSSHASAGPAGRSAKARLHPFLGANSRTHQPFAGDLPFGPRFGDSKAALIAKLGAPDLDGSHVPPMRWDTARYALYASLDSDGLFQLSLQLPYVPSTRPGFEER
jgi:hypothetical protein